MHRATMSERLKFRLMALIHEDLYSLLRKPEKTLRAAGLREGLNVLEVGCGPGFFTLPAAMMVGPQGRLITLDINPVAVERVTAKVEKSGARNIDIRLADAARTGLPDRSFDLIFVFGVSWRRSSKKDVYRELHRILRAGGTLAIEGFERPPEDLFVLEGRNGNIRGYRKVEV